MDRTQSEGRDNAPMAAGSVTAVWCIVTLLASTAAIFTRYCSEIPATSIGFWRVAGAAVIFLPFWFVRWRKEGMPWPVSRGAALAGFFLGVHFATWCWAIQKTTIANASLFIGLQPLIAPFIARWVVGEKLNRGEIVAVFLAFVGMLWLVGLQYWTDRAHPLPAAGAPIEFQHVAGMAAAFASAGLCAAYFVVSRKYRPHQHVLLFSTSVYACAAVTQALCALVLGVGIKLGHGKTLWGLAALIVLPTIGGHTLAMYLLRHAKAQLVAMSVPAQFVGSSLLAALLFKELPEWWFYPGAALVGSGVVLGVIKGAGGHVSSVGVGGGNGAESGSS